MEYIKDNILADAIETAIRLQKMVNRYKWIICASVTLNLVLIGVIAWIVH